MLTAPPWRWQQGDLLLQLHVQPRASRDQFCGLYGDAVKLAVTAPPVDGKANLHIQKVLAAWFGVSKQQVLLERGELSRQKQWRICQPTTLPAALLALGLPPNP